MSTIERVELDRVTMLRNGKPFIRHVTATGMAKDAFQLRHIHIDEVRSRNSYIRIGWGDQESHAVDVPWARSSHQADPPVTLVGVRLGNILSNTFLAEMKLDACARGTQLAVYFTESTKNICFRADVYGSGYFEGSFNADDPIFADLLIQK